MRNLTSYELLDWLWRLTIAHVVTLVFLFLSLASFYFPLTGQVRPYFILIVIYYWSINRPTLIPPFLVFLIGVFYDLILGFPIGLHAILFICINWVVKNQRLFFMGQPYIIVWLGFGCTVLITLCFEYLFFSAVSKQWLELTPLLNSFLITAFSFPLLTLVLIIAHRFLPEASKSLN